MRKEISVERSEEKALRPSFKMNLRLFGHGDPGSDDNGDDPDDESDDDDNGNDDDKGDKDKGGQGDDPNAGKTYTQTEVAALLRQERKLGARDAYKKFGITNRAEAESMTKKISEYVQNEKKKNSPESIKVQQAIQDAESRAMMAEIKVEALSAGVKKDCLDDMIAIALPKIEDDTDELATVFAGLKKKYPFMFSDYQNDDDKGTGGTGGTGGRKKNQNEDFGKTWAKSAKGNAPKTSFFSRS